MTPIRFLYRARRQFAEKVGVVDGQETFTYREHFERCLQLANLLRALGLRPGAPVAFLTYNTHRLLEAYSGVLLARGLLLPLNIRFTPEDLAFVLNDCQAQFLFFHPDFAQTVATLKPHLECLERSIPLGPLADSGAGPGFEQLLREQQPHLEFDYTQVDEEDVAELFYTSGTTARPKGVMLTHRNLYLHALEVALTTSIRESDVQLHTIPLFHVNGWGTPQFLTCMGGRHVMLHKFRAEAVFREIERCRVTIFSMVPTMATALVHYARRRRFDLSSLRRISLGGSAATPELVRQVEETFGCECVAGYGLTETSPVLTMSDAKSYLGLELEQRRELQSRTGCPIPGVELEIVDTQDQSLPWDGEAVGEIVVRGDGVMKGYWNRPEEERESLRGGWFHTGDMAVIDPHGYVTIVDRKKDIIVSGGENISSLEIEKTLLSHPAVLECAVIPAPDPDWGETPLALVVLKEGSQVDQEALLAHCRSRLAGFKVPRRMIFLPSLPKGGTGKILKRRLRQQYGQGREG